MEQGHTMQARVIGVITALTWPRGTIQTLSHVHYTNHAQYEPNGRRKSSVTQEVVLVDGLQWPVSQEAMDCKVKVQLTFDIRMHLILQVWEYILTHYSI
jgi:hypothetical protein